MESNHLRPAYETGVLVPSGARCSECHRPAQLQGRRRLVPESNRFHSSDSRAAIPIASRGNGGERWESNPRFQGHILACCRNTSSTSSRSSWNRTSDLLVPNEARYHFATLRDFDWRSGTESNRRCAGCGRVPCRLATGPSSSPGRTRTCNPRLNRAPHDHRAAGEGSGACLASERGTLPPRPQKVRRECAAARAQ